MAGKYNSERIQAHYLALAGIEKAKALLYQDTRTRSRAGVHHGTGLYDSPAQFQDVPLGRGKFSVLRAGTADEGGGVKFGVSDEESRLNVNVAGVEQLTNLFGLTADVAAAIVDWRDGDSAVSPGGAESPYYESLQPPYLPRNAEFQTLRELLMVRGITPELLLGETPMTRDALPAATGESGSLSASTAAADVSPESGWAAALTAHSSVEDVDASGVERINVQTADIAALTGIRGLTSEIARAVVAYRTNTELRNLVDLLEVTAAPPPGRAPASNNQSGGPKVIDETLFKEIADHLTTEDRGSMPGMINVNTAGVDVLMCLPGVTRPLAQAIVAHRRANGFFSNVGALLDVPGMNRDLLKGLAPMVAVRSETFRILSEGRVGGRGSRQRIEVVVHVGRSSVTTLAYREDDL